VVAHAVKHGVPQIPLSSRDSCSWRAGELIDGPRRRFLWEERRRTRKRDAGQIRCSKVT